MIDVMKRLAELDAKNPNIVKEDATLDECGMMPMPGMEEVAEKPSMPASLNITAGSGEELSDMLTAIMQLAGLHKVTPDELGAEHDPMKLTAEPVTAVGPAASAGDEMRSVLDKLNPADGEEDGKDDKEETDESDEFGIHGVDNTPNNPNDKNEFDANQHAGVQNQAGSPGADKNRNFKNNPRASTMEQITANLFAEYQDFLNESE